MASSQELRLSPLNEVHITAGAKMVPFGGWSMPLSYEGGTLDEHRACREDAVVFDVSHLGTVRVEGDNAFDVLQRAFTNDLNRIEAGRAQYTHLLDADDASVLDDIIVWWIDDTVFDVMPNASNTSRVLAALADAEFVGEGTHRRAVLAVQGPKAKERLATVLPEPAEIGRFRVAEWFFEDQPCLVAGTGYTGEDGLELAVPRDVAPRVWDLVVSAGIMPAGLGARDTLRLEAGLPLHGHELGPGITPLQAGLGWVVRPDKGDFLGRAALEAEKEAGVGRKLVGLVTESRRPPRDGQLVLADGGDIGFVTSGNFSPALGVGIALALVVPETEIGDAVAIDVRGTQIPATVVKPPFID